MNFFKKTFIELHLDCGVFFVLKRKNLIEIFNFSILHILFLLFIAVLKKKYILTQKECLAREINGKLAIPTFLYSIYFLRSFLISIFFYSLKFVMSKQCWLAKDEFIGKWLSGMIKYLRNQFDFEFFVILVHFY